MPSSASPDTPIALSLSRLQAFGALMVPIVAVVAAFFTLQGNVARAQEKADAAFIKATSAAEALQAINIRLERIQTVLERIERAQK
jgi:hypothetical protein